LRYLARGFKRKQGPCLSVHDSKSGKHQYNRNDAFGV
jgi:hypothetical protein